MQPGQTFDPGQPQEPQTQAEQTPQQLPAQPQPQQSTPTPDSVPETTAAQVEPGWQFNEGAEAGSDDLYAASSTPTVTWTASEYVAHDKNAGWYFLVVLAAVAVAAAVFLITRDMVSPIVVVVLGIAFAIFGARKPQVLEYSIDSTGVRIGQKLYPFGLFRTFSVIEEDAIRSILLMPLQRFNLPISIYYDPTDEPKIIEALSVHLPHEERRMSPVDNLMRKIRF